MVLVTQLQDTGIEIGLFDSMDVADVSALTLHEVPSEHYLRVIKDAVSDWGAVTDWYTRTDAESFTSIRGLIALINTLGPMHDVNIHVFTSAPSDAKPAEFPLVPSYSAEPNIGKRN